MNSISRLIQLTFIQCWPRANFWCYMTGGPGRNSYDLAENQKNCDTCSFSHNFSFCFFLLVSYSFILLAFIQLIIFCFPRYICVLVFSFQLTCILFFWFDWFCVYRWPMFPPPLSSHLKVFFHDSFSKSTLLCASFSVNFFWKGVWLLP